MIKSNEARMSREKRRKGKPTGRVHGLAFGGKSPPQVTQVQWPTAKEEIERLMLESALRSPQRGPYLLTVTPPMISLPEK